MARKKRRERIGLVRYSVDLFNAELFPEWDWRGPEFQGERETILNAMISPPE